MSQGEDQQFCLRWNNFQANFTSQFETLRDEEDFTDVTIACEGQRIQAHKVVLSACSPFFKELFKTNPCSHPIIFMRDVESRHILALMEFMYAGEVNVSQAHLSTFLKTAESLKIRGLTDTSSEAEPPKDEDALYLNPQSSKTFVNRHKLKGQVCTSTVTSSQDLGQGGLPSPPPKRQCKSDNELKVKKDSSDAMTVNPFALQNEGTKGSLMPKMELPDYISDEENDAERDDNVEVGGSFYGGDIAELQGGMEIIPQTSDFNLKSLGQEIPHQTLRFRRRRSADWLPYTTLHMPATYDDLLDASRREKRDSEKRSRLVKLGDGIEIFEEQLRHLKWSDYRKLTRGLATILFSPAELATCSVTGQRWSRAGSGERPVKPALDRAKVQAIISYVASRFPMIGISRIKQVLAYKCKENSTAFKMKAVRFYGEQHSQ